MFHFTSWFIESMRASLSIDQNVYPSLLQSKPPKSNQIINVFMTSNSLWQLIYFQSRPYINKIKLKPFLKKESPTVHKWPYEMRQSMRIGGDLQTIRKMSLKSIQHKKKKSKNRQWTCQLPHLEERRHKVWVAVACRLQHRKVACRIQHRKLCTRLSSTTTDWSLRKPPICFTWALSNLERRPSFCTKHNPKATVEWIILRW